MAAILAILVAVLAAVHADIKADSYRLFPINQIIPQAIGLTSTMFSHDTPTKRKFNPASFHPTSSWQTSGQHTLNPVWFNKSETIYGLGVVINSGYTLGFTLSLYDEQFNLIASTGTCGNFSTYIYPPQAVICTVGQRSVSPGRYYIDIYCPSSCAMYYKSTSSFYSHYNVYNTLPSPEQYNSTSFSNYLNQPSAFVKVGRLLDNSTNPNGSACSTSRECLHTCCCRTEAFNICVSGINNQSTTCQALNGVCV
jgi:hypothetical protein